MEYKTYKKVLDSWYTYELGDHPLYYVQAYVSYTLLGGKVYKISSSPDFESYCTISEYMLDSHFALTLDRYNNIFMKVT